MMVPNYLHPFEVAEVYAMHDIELTEDDAAVVARDLNSRRLQTHDDVLDAAHADAKTLRADWLAQH